MQKIFTNLVFDDVRDCQIVKDTYINNDNYVVIDNHISKSNICILFVSGNGLYYPNTEPCFNKVILEDNRFEWMNISKNSYLKKHIKRFIFIRDIYKQWYLSGINNKIDSISLLIDFIKPLTDGYDLYTVGNSAGGGIAFLLGCFLNAKRCFSISGQFDIEWISRDFKNSHKNPFVTKECSENQIDNWCNFLRFNNINLKVYYLYPAKCVQDLMQAKETVFYPNIFHYPFNLQEHGSACFGFNFPYLFLLSDDILQDLSVKREDFFSDGIISEFCCYSKRSFLKKTVSLEKYYFFLFFFSLKFCLRQFKSLLRFIKRTL